MKLLFFPFLSFSRSKLYQRLAGKTVLITGASFGIGECLAEALAETKARLLLVARTADKLMEVKQKVEARGGHADIIPCDLTNPAEVDGLLQKLLERPDGVDLFVNNAGTSIRRSIFDSLDRPPVHSQRLVHQSEGHDRNRRSCLPRCRGRHFSLRPG